MKALEEYIKQSGKEYASITENGNQPIGGRHWLIRNEQVMKDVNNWHTSQLQGLIKLLVDEMEKRKRPYKSDMEYIDEEVSSIYNCALSDLQQELTKLTTE